jgi:chitodextrinase
MVLSSCALPLRTGRAPHQSPRSRHTAPHESRDTSIGPAEEQVNRTALRALHLATLASLLLGSGLPSRALAQVTQTSVTLAWTAPGDDSLTGQATRYDVRWSLTPITSVNDFALATAVAGVPSPQSAGASESVTVSGLTPQTTYWFAVRTMDEVGNTSGLSNPLSATTLVSTDLVRPAPVPLALDATTSSSATVSWNDVGDDSLTGVASAVEIRWATVPITEGNWAAATAVFGVPQPGAPGTHHQLAVPGLDRTRDLWFAARARDKVNHVSALAPALLVPHLLDTAPPATPGGLTTAIESAHHVRVHWAANSEPDLAGYHVYRALAANAPFSRLTTTPVSSNDYLDTTAPDSLSAWYSVSAVDATGNESARSAASHVFLQGAGIAAWSVTVPFPNPSHAGGPVTIPLEVPGAGPYDATVEIQDAAGQHVRTLQAANLTPGPFALVWDGRNDSGRDTVPGVYRAWLHAGDRRQLVRFVRTP